MEDELQILLDETIKDDIYRIGTMDIGSEYRKCAIEDLVKLYKLRVEEIKNEMELCEKRQARIMDIEERKEARFMARDIDSRNRQEQISEQVKDRYFKVGIAVAEIGLPLLFYARWMKRGFQFEETGAYTSTTFRGLFNRFKPTKK